MLYSKYAYIVHVTLVKLYNNKQLSNEGLKKPISLNNNDFSFMCKLCKVYSGQTDIS